MSLDLSLGLEVFLSVGAEEICPRRLYTQKLSEIVSNVNLTFIVRYKLPRVERMWLAASSAKQSFAAQPHNDLSAALKPLRKQHYLYSVDCSLRKVLSCQNTATAEIAVLFSGETIISIGVRSPKNLKLLKRLGWRIFAGTAQRR